MWEQNSGSLEEQYILLTAKPSPTLKNQEQFVLLMCSWLCAFHWRVANLPGVIPLKKTDSPLPEAVNWQQLLSWGLRVQLLSPGWDSVCLEIAQVLCMLS